MLQAGVSGLRIFMTTDRSETVCLSLKKKREDEDEGENVRNVRIKNVGKGVFRRAAFKFSSYVCDGKRITY